MIVDAVFQPKEGNVRWKPTPIFFLKKLLGQAGIFIADEADLKSFWLILVQPF